MEDGELRSVAPVERRHLLRDLGVASLAATAAVGLLRARPARAATGTTGTFWDEGGAVFNVMAYGATGNGSTDDTSAIRAAISAANSAKGGVVFFPQGNYLISGQLSIPGSGIQLVGAGQNATAITVSSSYASGDVILFSNVSYGSVRMLSLTSQTARTGGAAIHMATANEIYVQDVDMAWQYVGCQIDGPCILNYIDRGYWTNFSAGGMGIWINTTGNDQYISNIVMDNSPTLSNEPVACLRIQATGAVWCHQCDMIHGQNGLLIDPPSNSNVTWLFFSDCAWDTCGDRCILISPGAGGSVRGVNFTNCWSSTALNYDGCYIGGAVDGVQFVGHRFFNNASNGLIAYGPATNIFLDACGAAGNGGKFSGSQGIGFANSCSGFAVRNCRSGAYAGFGVSQAYGITVVGGCDNYILTGNITQGNSSAGINDGGGPTKVVANNL